MRVGVPPKGAALSDKYLVRILKTAPVAPGKESAKIFIICSSAADCCLKILDFENNLICWWHETGTFMLIGFIIMASLVITNLLRLEKVRICNILDILSLSKTQSSISLSWAGHHNHNNYLWFTRKLTHLYSFLTSNIKDICLKDTTNIHYLKQLLARHIQPASSLAHTQHGRPNNIRNYLFHVNRII